MNVLVVDDNHSGRQLLVDIIQSMNLDVLQAGDGPTALATARQFLPDLVILDVNMPGMTGFEVCRELKGDDRTSHIPVLILTARDNIDSRVVGLQSGADDYLSKPFNPRELIERVKTRLHYKVETDDLRHMQQRIRQTFERYVAPSVVDQLLRDATHVKLGGKQQEITVIFIDLEGSTGVAERTDPEILLSVLNSYHTMFVGAIREHGGTVDKFLGDGVMALYNTPLLQPDHALRAVKTALQIRDSLPEFHKQFDAPLRMSVNFGIHSGTAVVGNVGAPDIMNYTAVGDTVNLAARLQSLSKNGQILISQSTCETIGDAARTRSIGAQRIKGRTQPIGVYEVLSLAT